MVYSCPENYITYLETLGSHPGLETINELLNRLGSPHLSLRCIHIAGTNGKGSVAAYLTSILAEAGYQIGTYTSPEITDIRETLCINKIPISYAAFDAYLKQISIHAEKMYQEGFNHPTRFEVLTALAFLYFKASGCDIAVIETGMGGRLDATNVIVNPLCSVLTAIALDHTQFLGDTLEAIAFEKSGIIKPCAPVILYPSIEAVNQVIKTVCLKNSASLTIADFDKLHPADISLSHQTFCYKNNVPITIALLGKHQIYNAALVLEVIEVLKKQGLAISETALLDGFYKTVWPGRFERVCEVPLFFIDGAHNVQGADALAKTLCTSFQDRKLIFIMGLLKDKDYQTVCRTTAPLAECIFTVTPANSRALDAKTLAEEASSYCSLVIACDSVMQAVQFALQTAASDDVIVAFGSLYFIGQIPKCIKAQK